MNGKRFAALGQIAVLVLFAALLGAWMYHINLNSQRMDVSALSNGAPLPENGPVLLTGGQTSYQDEDGHACYIMTLHWDGVSYLYFPRARNISINGSAQGILPAYRGYTYQLEPGQENDGIYEIVISSPYARLLPLERCVYFGSYEQISDFLDFSVMVNTYVQGMCFAVMLLSAVLFLFKRSEYYLIWLVLLAFFRGS